MLELYQISILDMDGKPQQTFEVYGRLAAQRREREINRELDHTAYYTELTTKEMQ